MTDEKPKTVRSAKIDLELFDSACDRVQEALESMGYTELREGQAEPIDCILMGRDTFLILPTGGGKTLVMAVPTIACKWQTVVLSPLKALMVDQVNSMCRKGVRAAALTSDQPESLNTMNLQDWASGELQVLYVAPERLENEQFKSTMRMRPPEFVVVDEAHVMSQASSTFRPSYARCGDFVEEFNPKVVLMMTATATQEIVDDVKRIMRMPKVCLCRHYKPRENLHLESESCKDFEVPEKVLGVLRRTKGKCIIYCSTVKQVENMVSYLSDAGQSVTWYNGQMPASQKELHMADFMAGRVRTMIATNAFGMGIDAPDIETIIHAAIPGSVEAISQETGRAARDGRDALCIMFHTDEGYRTQAFLFKMSNPRARKLTLLYDFLQRNVDRNGEVRMTLADIVQAMGGDVEIEGAMGYLTSLGCVERIAPSAKLVKVILNTEPDEAITAMQKNTMNAIVQEGFESGFSDQGKPIFEVALESLAKNLGVSEATVRSRISAMKKTRCNPDDANSLPLVTTVDSTFRGKVTRLIHPPTDEDLEVATKRYKSEAKKLDDVIRYCRTPNEEKQQFLASYFDLNVHE